MNEPLHIIFCGTPEFAVPGLEALIHDNAYSVDLVITQPDKPVGRKQVITPSAIKVTAEKNNILTWQPVNINKEWNTQSIPPTDFLVVIAYGQILAKEILMHPKIAPVNVHASLLPKHRGASPIQHTILHGDKEGGVTIQRMVQELDAGPILSKESITLDAHETALSLHDKLSVVGADLLVRTLREPLTETEQNDSEATVCSKLSRKDGIVDSETMTAEEIDRRVRALIPWPGVTWNNVKLLSVSLNEKADAFALSCADDTTLYVTTVQQPGKKPMTGAAWQHGRK